MTSSHSDPTKHGRRLAASTSPYLRQHAENPVDWWPWCAEALDLAHASDRPILLSIGYSACHWCHVMAHESFEDTATAELMNRLFVNIKVDREERPDLDRIYQTAHQLLAQRPGGWPLTVFLSPQDQRPFFAGTYFPSEPRHGLPAFKQLLIGVERAYREQREAIEAQNEGLMTAFAALEPRARERPPDSSVIHEARRELDAGFDPEHGGFGGAPKFPHPTNLELLLQCDRGGEGTARSGREQALVTLERMARGGLMDQLGGGFFRYSVDARWMIPHFEKMLYDNGPLLALYTDAFALTEAPLFGLAARMTAEWVMREMQAPEGGYYASLDADSEGEEGRFYLWDREEVRALLSPAEDAPFAAMYGLDGPPNFEGRWHLHTRRTEAEVAAELGLTHATAHGLIAGARATLEGRRATRVRPGRDDKILTAWNALMIKGMARAARVLDRPDYLESAEQALGFIRARLWREGRLLATDTHATTRLDAYLDDHAMLIDALLELVQTRWSSADLAFATTLADTLLERFEDRLEGGFWLTAHDQERLFHRPKPLADEALPAGNGVAARVLLRLGHLLGEPRYLRAAEDTLRLAATAMERLPQAHASLLMALDEWLDPPEMLIVRADEDRLDVWRRALQRGEPRQRLVFAIPSTETALPAALATKTPGARPRVYRCRGTQCEAPIEHLDALLPGARASRPA